MPSRAIASVIGTGGSIIRAIEKRSKAKVMVVKEAQKEAQKEEKRGQKGNAAAGAATGTAAPAAAATTGSKRPSVTLIHLFGSAAACSLAKSLIEEAVAAGSKRAKEQREQHKGSSSDAAAASAARERHIQLLRHEGDFRTLGLTAEACSSAAEVRAAFRGLAKKWHPDKFRGSKEEGENGSGRGAAAGAAAAAAEAAAKFRGIQQAYEALMEASGVLFGEDGN